jgi:hypothetical protein
MSEPAVSFDRRYSKTLDGPDRSFLSDLARLIGRGRSRGPARKKQTDSDAGNDTESHPVTVAPAGASREIRPAPHYRQRAIWKLASVAPWTETDFSLPLSFGCQTFTV